MIRSVSQLLTRLLFIRGFGSKLGIQMYAYQSIEAELTPRRVLSAPFRPRTYANLLYLALAFPLGLVYFVGVVVGLSLGSSLAITLVGIPILLATILGAILVAGFEAKLTTALVGVEVPLPEVLQDGFSTDSDDGPVDSLKRILSAPTTWTSLLLLLVKFGFGVAAFTLLVTVGAVVGALLAAPFLYADPNVSYTVGVYAIEILPAAVTVAAVGVVLGVLAFSLCNLLAIVGGTLNAALLGIGSDADTASRSR